MSRYVHAASLSYMTLSYISLVSVQASAGKTSAMILSFRTIFIEPTP